MTLCSIYVCAVECHVAAIRYSNPVNTSILNYSANMPPSAQGSQKCKLVAFSIDWYYFLSKTKFKGLVKKVQFGHPNCPIFYLD